MHIKAYTQEIICHVGCALKYKPTVHHHHHPKEKVGRQKQHDYQILKILTLGYTILYYSLYFCMCLKIFL